MFASNLPQKNSTDNTNNLSKTHCWWQQERIYATSILKFHDARPRSDPLPAECLSVSLTNLLLVTMGTLHPLTWLSSVSVTSICRGNFGTQTVSSSWADRCR